MLGYRGTPLVYYVDVLAGERVEITDDTRPLYRELVAAGWMIPLHTFALGSESAYRLTEQACDLRDSLTGQSNRAPSP